MNETRDPLSLEDPARSAAFSPSSSTPARSMGSSDGCSIADATATAVRRRRVERLDPVSECLGKRRRQRHRTVRGPPRPRRAPARTSGSRPRRAQAPPATASRTGKGSADEAHAADGRGQRPDLQAPQVGSPVPEARAEEAEPRVAMSARTATRTRPPRGGDATQGEARTAEVGRTSHCASSITSRSRAVGAQGTKGLERGSGQRVRLRRGGLCAARKGRLERHALGRRECGANLGRHRLEQVAEAGVGKTPAPPRPGARGESPVRRPRRDRARRERSWSCRCRLRPRSGVPWDRPRAHGGSGGRPRARGSRPTIGADALTPAA